MGKLRISDRLLVRAGAAMLLGSILVGQITRLTEIEIEIPGGLLFPVGLVGFLMIGWSLLHKSLARQKLVNDHIRKSGGDSRLSADDRLRNFHGYDRRRDRLP